MNKIITPQQMVESVIETGKRVGKEHGLSEEDTARLIYEAASWIGNTPMGAEKTNKET